MLWLMQAGGLSIWFVAVFGLVALGAAALFVRRPETRRLQFIKLMSRATLYSVGAGVAANVAAVFLHVTGNDEWAKSPELHLMVMMGLAESLAPAILGFTLLSLAAFLSALGVRRAAPEG